jgi:hypothetical protein
MLAQPSVVLVLVATAHVTLPDGRTLPALAYQPATATQPAVYELGARILDDGCWEIEEVIADTVEIELVGGAL